jgi:PAS domain S-box-containing protein
MKKKSPPAPRRRGPSGPSILRALTQIDALLVCLTDAEGEVLSANGAWEQFSGHPESQLRSEGWRTLLHPEDRASALGIFQAALAARSARSGEFRLRGSNGQYRSFHFTAAPCFERSRFLGYLCTASDISLGKRNQEALRDSESRYRDLAESIGDCFFALDREQCFTYWNAACEKAFGRPASSVIGRRINDLIPGFDLPGLLEAFERVRKSGAQESYECQLRQQEAAVPLEVSVNPTQSGVSVIARDISERREAERALRLSESKYRNIFENANDAILIVEPRTQKILEANSRALQLYGFEREEFLGMSLKQLSMDVVRGEQQISQTMEIGSSADFETVHFRHDGTPMTLIVNASVIEYRGGAAILSIHRDVSRILTVEEVLKSQDNILQRLLASSDDAVFMQDKDGRYLFYNGSPRFTLRTEEVRGKNPYDFYPAALARKMMERLYQVFSSGRSLSAETQLEWQGETFWFLDQLSPVRNAGGEVVSVVTISRNITDLKRAEEKLRRSEERYRAFIEQSSEGIWRLEMLRPVSVDLSPDEQVEMIVEHGQLAECNEVIVRMLGHVVAESLIGSPTGSIIDTGNPQSLETLRRFIAAGYQLSDVESREADPEGLIRTFSSSYTGILEKGMLVRIWGSRKDITERKQVEREMRLLAQTITSTKDCVSIADLDERILFVNDALVETYGYTADELIGKSVAIFYSPSLPPELPHQILNSAVHGGWNGELLHRRKDGGEFPVELWRSVVRSDEGDPVALVAVARDISDRRRMEEALRRSEARLRRITDSMHDIVTQTDTEGRIQYISPSVLPVLGYRPEESLGISLFERMHPEDAQRAEEAFRAGCTQGTGMSLEFRYRHFRGDYLWLEAVGNMLLDPQGAVVGAVFGIRDISERKRAEEQVRASLEEKEVLLKEIHHRVKNNLQVISSLLSLQTEHVPDERVRKILRDSQNRIRSMAIIHQRLYQSANLAEINFAGYIDELCAQLFRSYGAFEKKILLHTEAEDIFLSVDKAIPCGIIINELVSNALKYAFPDGAEGRVTVEFTQETNGLCLVVSDDGVGLPGTYDLHAPESLGLRLVHLLVEQVGGSASVGEGSSGSPERPGTRWQIRFTQ